MIDREIFQKLAELKHQGINAALATIVETSGSTPREVGAKMIICADGSLYGTVGGGLWRKRSPQRRPEMSAHH